MYLYLIIGIVIGFALGYVARGFSRVDDKFANAAMKRVDERDEKLHKVREFVERRGEVSNNDIEQEFSVSDATATRYMDALEKEGFVEQTGKGRSIVYRVK